MTLTKNEFCVLRCLMGWDSNDGAIRPISQRVLSERTGLSLGTVNSTYNSLRDQGLLNEDGSVSDDGVSAMRPYRVDNAVIMAAGFASRCAPLSYEKPKGLFTVKGEILIERQIRQLKEAGVSEIYVVVGYMKELFFYLEKKLGVKIIVNDDYYRRNNTSSLFAARYFLRNTFICSSDNYFTVNV